MCTFQNAGVAISITVPQHGLMGLLARQSLAMIRFSENTTGELYNSSLAVTRGSRFEKPEASPLVSSRDFDLETASDFPSAGC
ncbi:MAG: hypothetical protein CMM07_27275 [Rhodopirellula sp.]|nr:hypothetical protein [Rhodopirellula sp.]